jgi:glyoxylase-like metal-dependent hydrolase (beta-lactamase superfamily II)
VVLFEEKERKVFVGDVLFAGSVGRTDLPGGSTEQLMDSIIHKLLPLGDDVEVYSGHGPVTTIGHERKTNPFLTGLYELGSGRI